MEAKYVSPFMVCSIFGLFDFIVQIIFELIGYNYKNFLSYKEKEITLSLLRNVEMADIPSILLKSIPFIILYIIFYCCYYLIIDKFTVIHGVIMEIITLFSDILIKRVKGQESYKIAIFSILYIFIIIGLFIYIEIIELKFCGLNKYTRREILDREKKERKNISEGNENSNRVSINSDFDLELDPIIDK
jgi:predicted ferric reductase